MAPSGKRRRLAWLSEVAVRHNDIVDALASHRATLPLRLGGPVSIPRRRSWPSYAQCEAEAVEFLAGMADRQEWAVKVYLAEEESREPVAAQSRSRPRRRWEERPARNTWWPSGTRSSDAGKSRSLRGRKSAALEEALQPLADSWRQLRVLPTTLTGRTEKMISNGAFLVSRVRQAHIPCGLRATPPRISGQGADRRGDGALAAVSFLPRTATVKEDDTMSLHLLGIARYDVASGDPLIVPADLHRHGVCWVAQEDVAAAVMPSSCSPLAPLSHARLLETIHCRMDVLPIRYGVEMPDKRAVRDLLRQRRSELLRSLKRLKGTGEMGLRIELAVDEEPSCVAAAETVSASAASSPLCYLASRRQQYERKDRWELTARRVADHYSRSPQRPGGRLPPARLPATRHCATGLSGRTLTLGGLPATRRTTIHAVSQPRLHAAGPLAAVQLRVTGTSTIGQENFGMNNPIGAWRSRAIIVEFNCKKIPS